MFSYTPSLCKRHLPSAHAFCSVLLVVSMVFFVSGCVGSLNTSRAVSAGTNLFRAASISDAQLSSMSAQLRNREDKTNQVAPANSPYTRRLNKLMANLKSVNGIPLSYKVYITKQVNANAAPDGSVRVFSGLMDIMNDNELRFVLGHEIGHVAYGHSKGRLRTAYVTAAVRDSVGAYGAGSILSDSVLGQLATNFVNAQYSQSNELEADQYGLKFLHDNGYPLNAAITCMSKLQGSGGFFSSHPSSKERISKLQKTITSYGGRLDK